MTALDALWIVPLMLVLLALKGFFSGSEIALVNASRIKLRHAARQGDEGARLVLKMFEKPERVLTTTLVGTNIATVSLTTLGTLLMIHFLGEGADLIAFLVYTPILLVLGEIVPKAVFQERANVVAPRVIVPLRAMSILLWPLVVLFSSIARFAARRFGGPVAPDSIFGVRDQLRSVMEMAERGAGAEAFDRLRMERAIRFPDTTVGERMVPIGEMVAVDRSVSTNELIDLASRTGSSHIPVYEGNVSNVVGVISLTPWEMMDPGAESRSLEELMQPPTYLSSQQTLDEVSIALHQTGEKLGVVVDEFGSAVGVITMTEVFEAVVGEIELGYTWEDFSSHVRSRHEALEDGSYLLDGRLSISELNDLLGLSLPATQFHTVAGLITSELRRLARPGDEVEVDGYRFRVEEGSERVITRVRVERDRVAASEEGVTP
jgi:CBS domain containing-hemolysin-like protein